ncbi:MAG: 1-acyl-sn-glycerol-3-phosphate acyltransferase [Planctomycetales bacterium]|nr:1-acyl-sn-glycerol-3-phosphate acyltransferase [Planctomycetales bacterium]
MKSRSWARRWTYSASRWMARLVGLLFFRFRCTGRENWPREGGALVCANHQSVLDPVIIGATCDRRLNYLARDTLFRFAPFRWLIQWYDAIPIRREGLGLDGLKETLRRLKRGEAVLIFPEGTRTHTGELGEIQAGFCTLARRSQSALVPVGIDGAFRVWPRTRRLPWPAPIAVHIGEPLTCEVIRDMSDEELLSELKRRMADCLARAQQMVK